MKLLNTILIEIISPCCKVAQLLVFIWAQPSPIEQKTRAKTWAPSYALLKRIVMRLIKIKVTVERAEAETTRC
jgi:hypothetical protein